MLYLLQVTVRTASYMQPMLQLVLYLHSGKMAADIKGSQRSLLLLIDLACYYGEDAMQACRSRAN